jgi:phenylacetate-CoA ligase
MIGAMHPSRAAIRATQEARLRLLLRAIDGNNPFYTEKMRAAGIRGDALDIDTFCRTFPFTTKAEVSEDQRRHPPYGSNLTFPLAQYVRYSQTSGSSGAPLRWLDTAESWSWMLGTWDHIYRRAGITAADRLLVAFSFGPFLGFWTAFDAAAQLGCLCIPGGGLSSEGRLRAIADNAVTVLCCTPTYAIRLGQIARELGITAEVSTVRRIIVAGEPGGSIPATRARIEELWSGATVLDHHGMAEIGPVSYQCPEHPSSLHVLESALLAEIIDPDELTPVAPGQVGELVLTNFGRVGSPLLRYRTGDLVRASTSACCSAGIEDLLLEGGIIGRRDDMIVVRGVNVYPAAIEAVIRRFSEVAEYRVELRDDRSMSEVRIEIEPAAGCVAASALASAVSDALHAALVLRVAVCPVEPGSLPPFEMKAQRWIRLP